MTTWTRRLFPLIAGGIIAIALHAQVSWAGDLSAWKSIAEGGAVVELAPDSSGGPENSNSNSLRLTVKHLGTRAGMVSYETGLANLQAGQWYDLSFDAHTEKGKHFLLVVSLESQDGRKVCARATIPEIGGERQDYHLSLHARQSEAQCRMVITFDEPGTIWFNAISIVPRP